MEDTLDRSRAATLRKASKTLATFVDDDPSSLTLLDGDHELPDRDGYRDLIDAAWNEGSAGGLRLERRRRLAEIAARDLAGELSLERVGRALSDLADACIEVALAHADDDGLVVIAMGKLGGRELNYSSDIDLMFVSDGDLDVAKRTCDSLLKTLGEFAPEGQAYRIDLNLRPEGRSGPIVRSLDGYLEYYKRWAEPWEFQALIKARACAGNVELGERFMDETRALVFPAQMSPDQIESIRKMKQRVEGHAQKTSRKQKSKDADDVKLGPGGIRDIEFSVQLLQLVHGGQDHEVRSGNTLEALGSLVDGGYVAEDDGAGLSVAYMWLRNVEHRLQLWQERQVHHLPIDPERRAHVARVMGFRDTPEESAVERFDARHRAVLADVRGRFERLFYRPMIEALAEGVGPRLSQEGIKERLAVLGFRDVDRSARTLEGLVSGTSRRAKLFRVLSPALLRFLASTPSPDEGLFAFLRLGEALEGRLDVLGALRENPPGLEFLGKVLGSGRLLGEVLTHVPEELATIADPRGPGAAKDRDRLVREAVASLGWREPERKLDGLRRFKRREMLRVALSDLSGEVDTRAVGAWLSDLADSCLEAALEEVSVPFAVIGMGKLGGRELNYASDIDVMFVHDGDHQEAEKVAERLMRAIGEVTPEGQAFRIDPGLRPEGKSGPLVRSVDSYLEYYDRWSNPWEHQALIKARVAAGDRAAGDRLVEATRRLAFPETVSAKALAEIRHLKARMERERIPRGTQPRRHLKMGPGGLADVEFAVQLLQLHHAHEMAGLRTTNTLAALEAARTAGLITEEAVLRLSRAYTFLMRLRDRLFFIHGRPVDALPVRPEEVEALGIAMGFTDQPRQELEEEYLRITRRARKTAEPLIYGDNN